MSKQKKYQMSDGLRLMIQIVCVVFFKGLNTRHKALQIAKYTTIYMIGTDGTFLARHIKTIEKLMNFFSQKKHPELNYRLEILWTQAYCKKYGEDPNIEGIGGACDIFADGHIDSNPHDLEPWEPTTVWIDDEWDYDHSRF